MPANSLAVFGVITDATGLVSDMHEGFYLLQKGGKKHDLRQFLVLVKQRIQEITELEKTLPIEIRLGIMDMRPEFFIALEISLKSLNEKVSMLEETVNGLKPHPRFKIWSTKKESSCKKALLKFIDETDRIRADVVKSTNAVREANGVSRTPTIVSWEPTKIPETSLIEVLSTQVRTFGDPKPTRAVDDIDVPPSAHAETARRRVRLSRTVRRLIPKKKPPPTIPVDRLVSPGASTSTAVYIPLRTIETRDTMVDSTPDDEPEHSSDPGAKASLPADNDSDDQ